MADVLLVGAFGQHNSGDEALCRALCSALADHDVVIASSDPAASTRQHGRPSIAANPLAVAGAVHRADAVVIGGGTVFKSLHPSSGRRPGALLRNTAALVAAANARHVPIAFVGVGAGELRGATARRLCRWIVPRADLVVLRDEESAAVLTDAGVEPPFWIGADPSWSLIGAEPPARPRAGERRVTVALSHFVDDARSWTDAVADALAHLAGEGWRIRLQLWQPDGADRRMADHLRRLVPGAELTSAPTDLCAAATDLAGDDLVLGMRFHSLVAAGAARTRFVAIAHEPKLAGLARRLGQVAVPPGVSAAMLSSSIDWALDHAAPSDEAVRREVALAGHTLRLLHLVLDEGRLDHPEDLPALQLSDGAGRW